MIFELAQDFHDAVAVLPREHPKQRMLELLKEAILFLAWLVRGHGSSVTP